jgi:hypothetical protein
VESVDLYEIKEQELDLFEKGSPADLQLNFAIFLLSLAFSAIVALSTADFTKRPTVQTGYIVVSVVGILGGLYLLIAWYRNRTSSKAVCHTIRLRMQETIETVKEPLQPTSIVSVAPDPTKPSAEPKEPQG